jgi:hypothetical protein
MIGPARTVENVNISEWLFGALTVTISSLQAGVPAEIGWRETYCRSAPTDFSTASFDSGPPLVLYARWQAAGV